MTEENKSFQQEEPTLAMRAPETASNINRKAYLVVLAGGEIGREIELSGRNQLFGRSLTADVRLHSPSISREHARIHCTGSGGNECYLLTDLDSGSGTSVNNVPISSRRLVNGDKVRMGDVLFKFVLADETDARFYQDIHRLIHFDQLTGLMTMEAFRRRLELEMQRTDAVFTVAMTDLDGLKSVNDTYGHLAGRMVIREMGALIRQCLRAQDVAALYGGDETIILFRATSLEQATVIAEKIRMAIDDHLFEHKNRQFHVSISQGLAEWPRHGETTEEIISAADAALYAAKGAGRNCVRLAG